MEAAGTLHDGSFFAPNRGGFLCAFVALVSGFCELLAEERRRFLHDRAFIDKAKRKIRMEEMAEAWAELGLAPTVAAQLFGQQFDLLTPMLVLPFGVFKAQGRIMKSTKVWRDEALAAGSLVVHEEGSSKTAIFISHHREHAHGNRL